MSYQEYHGCTFFGFSIISLTNVNTEDKQELSLANSLPSNLTATPCRWNGKRRAGN